MSYNELKKRIYKTVLIADGYNGDTVEVGLAKDENDIIWVVAHCGCFRIYDTIASI